MDYFYSIDHWPRQYVENLLCFLIITKNERIRSLIDEYLICAQCAKWCFRLGALDEWWMEVVRGYDC